MEYPGCRVCIKKQTMRMFGIFLFIAGLSACKPAADPHLPRQHTSATPAATAASKVGAIPLPAGYVRLPQAENSYGSWLRNRPLKKDNTVYLYNRKPKNNQDAQYAVLDIDVGNKDLQQCADAAIRLRADYLYARRQYDAIAFLFTNGFNCDYRHYASGYRLQVTNRGCTWIKKSGEDFSYATFRQYLDLVYSYAGTQSLQQQLRPVPFTGIRPGHVLLQSRQPYGHAVTVMDMAYQPGTGDTIFLLAQSYMPAQDIHILKNPAHKNLSPWYSVRFSGNLETPEWTFTTADLKSF